MIIDLKSNSLNDCEWQGMDHCDLGQVPTFPRSFKFFVMLCKGGSFYPQNRSAGCKLKRCQLDIQLVLSVASSYFIQCDLVCIFHHAKRADTCDFDSRHAGHSRNMLTSSI